MGEAFFELLFWIVIFIVFFFGFKWLQNKKNKKAANSDASASPSAHATRDTADTGGDVDEGGADGD